MLGLTTDNRVAVSEQFVGRGRAADDYVFRFVGEELIAPQEGKDRPADEHISWHTEQVFRGPARHAA